MPKPQVYKDIRKLLEDKSIDAISIATPNHWHSLMGIWACQAGKDVYVEKPCSHCWWEGHQLVAAARKYDRIVMHGTQGRSAEGYIEGVRKLREGVIGDVYLSRGLCFKWRDTIGIAKVEPVPAGVDYDLWTGPAPLKPFTRNRFHYNWHWIWDTGNGDVGNQGVHEMDLARWALGVGFPNKVSAIGGHVMFKDDQETPNILNCSFEFDMPDGTPPHPGIRSPPLDDQHGSGDRHARLWRRRGQPCRKPRATPTSSNRRPCAGIWSMAQRDIWP